MGTMQSPAPHPARGLAPLPLYCFIEIKLETHTHGNDIGLCPFLPPCHSLELIKSVFARETMRALRP
jgi:hypothetical protein